jgi:hypothetical protein
MKAEIERLFETLTWQFLNAFLSQRPQNPEGSLAPAFPNPQILLFDYPGTGLTFRIFSLISCFATLTLDTMTPDPHFAQVPPILHANHPILLSSHPILLSNHPI